MLFGLMSKYYTRTNTTLNYIYAGGWGRKEVFWMNCSLILYIDDNNAYRIAGSLEGSVCVEFAQQTFTL